MANIGRTLQNPANNIMNLPKNGKALSIKNIGKYLLRRILSVLILLALFSSDFKGESIL
jgi:hypothetical protein